MKNTIDKLKSIWENKRYRALISLGFYLLLIIFAIVFIKTGDSNMISPEYEVPLTIMQKYNQMDNYKFSCIVDEKELFKGYTLNGVISVTYNDKNYEIKDEITEPVLIKLMEKLNILNLRPINIYNLINKGTKVETGSDLKNNIYINKYEISLKDFSKEYEDKVIDSDKIVTITTYQDNNKIFKIGLDLINYNNTTVMIEYSE